MQQHQLRPAKGATKRRKRIGRGTGSGHGAFSTRGVKGQKARTGKKLRAGFEGGQTPLHQRMPKLRGFTRRARVVFQVVNVRDLQKFAAGTTVDNQLLKEKNMIRRADAPVKVLGFGELTNKITLRVDAISASAQKQLEKAGGSFESTKKVRAKQSK